MAQPTSPAEQHYPYFERLDTHHDRKAFDCGEASLNIYLQRNAKQNAERNLGITHVAVAAPGQSIILGYYTLISRDVERELFPDPSKLTPGGVGVVLLGRLAVDKSAQGHQIGSAMLLRAIRQTEAAARNMGIHAFVVHALTVRARDWYLKFGFMTLADNANHLYLAIETIRALGLSEAI